MIDATDLLLAREQALSIIHLWNAPDVVLQYLETGDEILREAAWSAAEATARERFAALVDEAFAP